MMSRNLRMLTQFGQCLPCPPSRFIIILALVLVGQSRQSSSSNSSAAAAAAAFKAAQASTGNHIGGLNYANLSDYNAWLQARQQATQTSANNAHLTPPSQHRPATVGGGFAIEVTPPPTNQAFQVAKHDDYQTGDLSSSPVVVILGGGGGGGSNRSTRTAVNYDDQEASEDEGEYKLIVSNTCERDFMQVEIKTSKPFYGVVHTLNYRRKLICTSEGDGGTQLRLAISHALNPNDPQHCGVTRLAARSPSNGGDKQQGELLSVIVAVRLHRNIELSEDKFFALNCTNRCRRPDCSSGGGQPVATGRIINAQEVARRSNAGLRLLEREQGGAISGRLLTTNNYADESDLLLDGRGSQLTPSRTTNLNAAHKRAGANCSTLWDSTWALVMILCMAIILVGMLISNCIICLSLGKRKSEVDSATDPQTNPSSNHKRASSSSQQIDEEEAPRRKTARRKSRQINYDNTEALNYHFQKPEMMTLDGQLQQQQQHELKRSHHHRK